MITVLTDKAWQMQVPPDATDCRCYSIGGEYRVAFTSKIQDPLKVGGDIVLLPAGKWKILGKASELDEMKWREVVETVDYNLPPSPGNDWQGDWATAWRDYDSDVETGRSEYPWVQTALESGLSLLKSKSLDPLATLILIKQ